MGSYVNFGPSADHKRNFTPKRCCRIWNFHTRLLPARRINLSCSRKAQPVYLAIRQCTGNRRRSAREAGQIVYTLNSKTYFQTVYAYSFEQDKSFAITDGLSEVSEPAFDAGGKYLYFFGSTDAGPVKQWFDMPNADMRLARSLYLAVLRKNIPSPLSRESDEEKGVRKEEKPKDTKAAAAEPFSIDFDGIQNRILTVPIPAGEYSTLRAGAAGQVFYLESVPVTGDVGPSGPPRVNLHRYDLNERKDDTLLNGVTSFEISGDTKKILHATRDALFITAIADKIEPGNGKLNTDAVEVRIDPRAEWRQIFNEAWRIDRDYFSAPNMHGVEWNAMRQKYSAFLPHLAVRSDLNRVIQWMCSELAVGHHRVCGGDTLYQPKSVPGGLLGADYGIENGRYSFKKVYGGLNWNPELRSPLTEPGVDVKAGEYLLAVQGKDLRPPTNLYSLFENTAGKIIEITVGPNRDGSGSRTASVVPIANEGVPPDIEVEQTQADVIAGRDPQLEKAIQVVMDELKKNPAPQPKRPPHPIKTGIQKPGPN